mgnify:CR=1 FL=1
MTDYTEILSAQRALFKTQATKDVSHRLKYLKALKSEIELREQDIYEALYKDFKKSKFESFISEFGLVISELNLVLKNLKVWAKPKRIKSSLLTFPSKDYIYNDPYGNVLVIAPWNYPFLLAIEPLIMAIAAGNTVVLKPSELTKHISNLITEIIEKVFPKNLAISIEGGIETSTKLLALKWDYIFFTGSTKVGKIIAKAAAKHLTPVTLELGGKSPCIIDNTSNLKLVARRLVWAKFFNGGQTCISADYVIVKSEIKEEFIKALKKEILKRYGENPQESEDFPRIINKSNTLRLKGLLKNTNVLLGGDIDESNNYVAPTIVDNLILEHPIMQEEIFGPILPILTYNTFEDIEDIIWQKNKPLSLYVFSNDVAFQNKMISTLQFGGGVINDLMVHFGNPRLPFGGIGLSGMCKYHGKYGYETFSHQKPIMKRGTWFDPSLRYPPYQGKLPLIKKIFKWLG